MCDLPYNSERGVKVHAAKKAHGKNDMTVQNEQVYKGSLADKEVRTRKVEEQQDQRPTIYCENKALENVFKFRYLGDVFAADGLQEYDMHQDPNRDGNVALWQVRPLWRPHVRLPGT